MHLFAFMRVNNLHSASPVVAGSMWKCMNEQGPQQTQEQHMLYGRLTSFIEIQVTAFDFVGWSCFWTMINPVLNTVGFAYDLCFYPLCGLRMGMLDTAFAAHNVGNTHETTNLEMGRQQMTSWLAAVDAAVDTFNVPCNSTNRFPFGYEGDFTQANSTLLLLPPTTAKS